MASNVPIFSFLKVMCVKILYIVALNTLKAYIDSDNSAFNIKLCSNKKGYPSQDNLLFELYLRYMIYLLLIYEAT